MKLLPPVLHGPLYPESISIYIEPVIDNAIVTVFAESSIFYEGPRSIDGWVKLEKELQIGQLVYAKQKIGADESPASINAVLVIKQSGNLPPPEFVSVINNYSSIIAMNQLVIGAKLEIFNASNNLLIASVMVERPLQYVRLNLEIPINDADYLIARQSFNGVTSATRSSPSLNDISEDVKTRNVQPGASSWPLSACRTDLGLVGIAGLELSVQNEGLVTNFLIAGIPSFAVSDCQPLQTGKLKVIQEIERVSLKGESPDYEVGPAAAPGKPRIVAPYCPQIQNLAVADLDPGANIGVYAWKPSENKWILIGTGRVWVGLQDITLPAEMLEAELISIDQTLLISVRQDRCGVEGEMSEPIGIGPYGPRQIPSIVEPVVDCSQVALLKNSTPGTQIMLFDQNNCPLLSKPYHPINGYNLIRFRSVQAGETIYGKCKYCDGEVEMAKSIVVFPAIESSNATRLEPIKPSEYLKFTNCIIGSRIDIYHIKNGAKKPKFLFHTYPLSKDWEVILFNPAVLDEEFYFIVLVCDKAIGKGNQKVKKGLLSVVTEPNTVKAGKVANVTVVVKDSYYGTKVSGDLYSNPPDNSEPLLSMANNPISWLVPENRTQPYTGIVKVQNYEDANYLINVIKNEEPVPQNDVTVNAELRLTSDWNIYLGSFQLTVKGNGFPPDTPAKLQYEYAYLVSDGINKYRNVGTASPGSFSADQNGNFTYTANFNLALIDPETGMVINQGVTAIVITGPTIYPSEFRRAMRQNDQGEMDKVN